MDRAQMRQVKCAARDAFASPLHDEAPFDPIQPLRIRDAKAISQDTRSGIDVRIAGVGHLAVADTEATM